MTSVTHPTTGATLAAFTYDVKGTRVVTHRGRLPIRDVVEGDRVLSRDKVTGRTAWRQVTATHRASYFETVTVAIRTRDGATQSIVSNRLHPYYVFADAIDFRLVVDGTSTPGTDATGRWIKAQQLKAGDRLLDETGSAAEVLSVDIAQSPLTAYNLTVEEFQTFFVNGADNDNAPAVWVHNCFVLTSMTKVEYQALAARRDRGSFATLDDSLVYHANKHFAGDLTKMLRSADGFSTRGRQDRSSEMERCVMRKTAGSEL